MLLTRLANMVRVLLIFIDAFWFITEDVLLIKPPDDKKDPKTLLPNGIKVGKLFVSFIELTRLINLDKSIPIIELFWGCGVVKVMVLL